MIRTDNIAEANIMIKKFLWLDIYMVDFNEEAIILFGTMDASLGKQVEIILKKICYIDMPTMWELEVSSENPIVFIPQDEMNENYKNRFLDNHNGVGDLFTFSAEGVNKGIQYHIVAGGFELQLLSYDSYFPWEINE